MVKKLTGNSFSRLILFLTLFVTLGFGFVPPAQAAGLFTLSNGQVQCIRPEERPYCIPEQELFSELVISIADNGEVSGQAQKSTSFEHAGQREGTTETYNGSASISIRGTYDYYSRTITGKFDYKDNLVYIVQRPSGDSDPLNKTSNSSGQPFTGKVDGDSLKIDFYKTFSVTYTGIPSSASMGKLDEDMDNWAITAGAEENKRNSKVYTGKINAEFGGDAGISDMYGQVEVNIPQPDGTYDEEDWSFAKLDGKTLPVGTHIKTSEKSGAMINFGQMIINLGPDSELVIAPVPDQPGQVELLWGNLKANVKKMMKDGSMEIEMSQAVAGIKGTTFILEETKDSSTIKVIEGNVSFTSKANGQAEMVNTGEQLRADKNGLGQKTAININDENTSWNKLSENFGKTSPQSRLNIYYSFGTVILLAFIISVVLVVRKKKRG